MTTDQQAGTMRQAVREIARLGLADMIKPVTDALAVVDTIDHHVTALVAQARQARDRLIAGLPTGTATIEDLALFTAISAGGSRGDFRAAPLLAGLTSQAKASAHADAYAVGAKLAPSVFDKLAERAATVVKTVAAAKLPADAYAEVDALRAKPADYRKVVDGAEELTRLHGAYAALRRVGWLPELSAARSVWVLYQDPMVRLVQVNPFQRAVFTAGDLVATMATGVGTEPIPAPLALWHACRLGAQPGLYSVEDAEKRHAAWVRKMASASAKH